jgi:hypothetical protein
MGSRKLWIVLAVLWIAGPIALLWSAYPREEAWRRAFIEQRPLSIDADRAAAYARLATQCQPGNKYDLISPQRRTEYLRCMDGQVELSVRDDLPREQRRVIAKGVALWLVPLISLYALGFAIARVRRRFRQTTS